MPSVIMLSVFMLNVTIKSITQNVIILSVFMLNVTTKSITQNVFIQNLIIHLGMITLGVKPQ